MCFFSGHICYVSIMVWIINRTGHLRFALFLHSLLQRVCSFLARSEQSCMICYGICRCSETHSVNVSSEFTMSWSESDKCSLHFSAKIIIIGGRLWSQRRGIKYVNNYYLHENLGMGSAMPFMKAFDLSVINTHADLLF